MSERVGYKPAFFHHLVEGHERELSPELRGVVDDFVQQMIAEYESRKKNCYDLLKRYPNDEGLKQLWTPEYIEAFASGADQEHAIEHLRSTPFESISWHDVGAACEEDFEKATLCIQTVFDAAEDHIKSGMYASKAVHCESPFERAQFSFIRNEFVNEWQPRGGIEASLVDMLAQCYVGWQYWLSLSMSAGHKRDFVGEQIAKTRSAYESGEWQPPRVSTVEYLDHTTQMADRFNRMFLRILRQMRDLRRYAAPVTINNPKQVNIASDGGQQNNVQKAVSRKKKAKKATARPALKIASKKG
ncbi:MAG: hypothetical protein WBV94_14840 [Blastocatellia bacterium]